MDLRRDEEGSGKPGVGGVYIPKLLDEELLLGGGEGIRRVHGGRAFRGWHSRKDGGRDLRQGGRIGGIVIDGGTKIIC